MNIFTNSTLNFNVFFSLQFCLQFSLFPVKCIIPVFTVSNFPQHTCTCDTFCTSGGGGGGGVLPSEDLLHFLGNTLVRRTRSHLRDRLQFQSNNRFSLCLECW